MSFAHQPKYREVPMNVRERELGSGGMATAYLAEDLKHHRKVAVKVLHPELAAVLGPDRFHREIEIAAQRDVMTASGGLRLVVRSFRPSPTWVPEEHANWRDLRPVWPDEVLAKDGAHTLRLASHRHQFTSISSLHRISCAATLFQRDSE
jgi:serine/threonine protein kinase